MANQPDNRKIQERLPIKVVMPKQGTEGRVSGGGGPKIPFRNVDENYRHSLSNQVSAIQEILTSHSINATPVRVKLISKATAKSHRPVNLFSEQTCPIVGAGRLGELFLKASPKGLSKLNDLIRNNTSEGIVKELSCIEVIEPITPTFRRGGQTATDILKKSPRGKNGFITRVKLFDFGVDDDQKALVESFFKTCKKYNLPFSNKGYSASAYTYSVECKTNEEIELLSKTIGVRSIAQMPTIRTVRAKMLNHEPLPRLNTSKEITSDFPVVVVVDSGVSESLPELESWVVGRKSHVAPSYRNTDHGTFVAGLICWGAKLNPTLEGLNDDPCGVYDLQVIPNNDPSRGDVDALYESEFLAALEGALQEHANRFKVWNLSLGTDTVCHLDEFSPLAIELDNLQEKYKVSFVISAGNYTSPPLLDYPRTTAQLDVGRITSPADSVLGITVGSISHVDYKKLGPKLNYPSAFSRHGSGPNYIIKPDLVHFGGSCTTDFSNIEGVRSINGAKMAQNIGTSFAAPLVSRTLAQIYHSITPTPSPVLARALLTHHARDPRTSERVADGDENYYGFGLPSPLPYCLECDPYTSTLVFDDVLRPGYFLEWDDFPFPPSLKRNGRYFGNISMTVAFAPSRGDKWGTEYCETNIDAHFGVYYEQVSKATAEVKTKFRGLVPPEHKNPGLLYESYQIEKLRKWAPVRTYFGDLGKNGERGNRWRLKLQLLTRHETDEDKSQFRPQPFSLIITISDPERRAPVYDEMAQIIRNRFQVENLTVRSSTRVQAR